MLPSCRSSKKVCSDKKIAPTQIGAILFYHGTLISWGILLLSLDRVKPDIRNSRKSGLILVGVTLWAKLGNVLLDQNWFFPEEDALYIVLVESGVIPKWAQMVVNPIVCFLAVLLYGVFRLIRNAVRKKMPV